MSNDSCYFCKGHPSHETQRKEVQLLRDAVDKSNVALEEAIKTKEERDRLLLQIEGLQKDVQTLKAVMAQDAKQISSYFDKLQESNRINVSLKKWGGFAMQILQGEKVPETFEAMVRDGLWRALCGLPDRQETEQRKCICPNGTRTAIAHVSGCPLED